VTPPRAVPTTSRQPVVEVLHGTTVEDPFRWLEETDAPAVASWAAAQQEFTESVLRVLPARDRYRRRLAELWAYPRLGVPFFQGGRWFQQRQDGLENQPSLYVSPNLDVPGTRLLDPNELSPDGTAAVPALSVSPDASLLAYARSDAGSDWMSWRVRRVEDGVDLPDEIAWSKFSSAAWLADSSGFAYVGFPPPELGRALLDQSRYPRVMLHRLGTPSSSDELLYHAPERAELVFSLEASRDLRWIVVSVQRGTFPESGIVVLDPKSPGRPGVEIGTDLSCELRYVGNVGSRFFFLTDRDAPRRRVVAVDLDAPAPERWAEIVPEGEDVLSDAYHGPGMLLCHRLHHARSRLECWRLPESNDGEAAIVEHVVSLPEGATVREVFADPALDVATVGLASFVDPGSTWALALPVGGGPGRAVLSALERPSVAASTDGVVADAVFVDASDGARVPVTLVRRRDAVANGEVPTILYGYGGFGISLLPEFSPTWLAWVERGGMVAVANLRGGGEYGQAWHDAGRLANKQRVFDDCADVARWLSSSGWTRPARLALTGRSNGGLLAAAGLTQHPELFGAVVPEVGVLDLLRFHHFTIGWAWTSDYGDPGDPEEFRWLLAYSPLHAIRPGTAYPPTLITTGDHDDRVVPAHSYKFAAALQSAQGGPAPILLRVETAAGHGAGKPTAKLVAERADVLAFLEAALADGLGAEPVASRTWVGSGPSEAWRAAFGEGGEGLGEVVRREEGRVPGRDVVEPDRNIPLGPGGQHPLGSLDGEGGVRGDRPRELGRSGEE
jgi:prolyl oligopeptidase